MSVPSPSPSPPPARKGEDRASSTSPTTPPSTTSPLVQISSEVTYITQIRHNISQPFISSFIAGGIAGAVSRTLVSPLERLKILLQVQGSARTEYKLSIPSALAKMWREEGLKGFMRGNGSNCIRIVPYSAVQFSSYGIYKRALESSPGAGLPPLMGLFCGACAGITAVCTTYPLDIVRTRLSIQSASFASLSSMRSQQKKLPGMYATLVQMYTHEGGFRALYRGIIPTVAGVAPYVGLNFMTYEFVRKWLTPEDKLDPSPVRKLCAGAMAGGFAQTCTYPFDVLRRRFQINSMEGMGFKYSSMWGAVKDIVGKEGVKGMYRGILPNLLKVAPSMASNWLAFEVTRDFLRGLDDEHGDGEPGEGKTRKDKGVR